ncbi:ATP-binding protein [Streptomyces chrestomyceticus]|uniref:wHTH domain-containing protein n=1 Tax=Streptomyces chrestomyceticus TaxID=68185 RepID=UPI0036BA5A34
MVQDGVRNAISGGNFEAPVIQAASVTVQTAVEPTPPKEPWVRAVLESGVWAHAAQRDAEPCRQHAARLAGRLAAVRDAAEQRIAGDPWADPGFATRFADRLEWLLGEPDGALDLYPAEAGMLVLLPYLYQAHQLLLVASRVEVDPADLRSRPQATGWRAGYQSFLAGHGLLVNRAELRPESSSVIGWWLYRCWLAQEDKGAGRLDALAAELVDEHGPLTEALSPRRLARILAGLRLGAEVCNAEHLGQLEADDVLPGPGHQRIRERRASLLLAVAYGAAIELAVLPDTLVEHTGIPNPVDLDGVRRTLAGSAWSGPPALPVLKAVCEHEAVVEALREHTERLDGLLLAVGRAVPDRITQPMPALPARVSADGVVPAEGTFSSGARFRLDDRRVRGLLTGTQLYKDHGLAVRELYQNALDACRYRRARTQYLERSGRPFHPYEGRIDFRQGVDEDGRPYLECSDDGIGMGEAELRGVFSHAGARFAEQPDFLLEQAEWERVEPPVRLYPNSRFGIGVLSYFMLADEIRVTSCRMGLDGGAGPVVEAHILGPNHLFRIVETAEQPGKKPGTRVRLYLRNEHRSWSGLDALSEVLHIAEFRTVAEHGGRRRVWEVGVFQPTHAWSTDQLVEWEDSPPGTQVIWWRDGGMLLVDGLRIEPGWKAGVLSGPRGVLVNLSGEHAPRQLSADRLTVLDDVSAQVEQLLTAAAPALVAGGADFLTLEWMHEVATSSPRTADLVAAAAFEAGVGFCTRKGMPLPAAAGCFQLDLVLIEPLLMPAHRTTHTADGMFPSVPDHLLIWRMLAHDGNHLALELTQLVPELAEPRQVVIARPSDALLLSGEHRGLGAPAPSDVFAISRRLGCAPAGPAARRRLFGVSDLVLPDTISSDESDAPRMAWLDKAYNSGRSYAVIGDLLEIGEWLGTSAAEAAVRLHSYGMTVVPEELPEGSPDEVDLQLLHWNGASDTTGRNGIWFDGPVPPGHVAHAALRTGLEPGEVKRRLERYSLEVQPFVLPDRPDQTYVNWLSQDHDGKWPWVSAAKPLTPWQILFTQNKLGCSAEDVRAEYGRLGFELPPRPTSRESPDDLRLLAGCGDVGWPPFRTDRVPGFYQLVDVSDDLGIGLRALVNRLAAYRVRTGMVLPQRASELDRDLFSRDDLLRANPLGPGYGGNVPWWHRLSPDDEIPFFRLVMAARDLGRHPKELAARLRSYGLRVSHDDLPPGLTHRDALRLLTGDDQRKPLPTDPPMSLAQLVWIARHADLPVALTAQHLHDMGVHVADLAETVRAALARVPTQQPE